MRNFKFRVWLEIENKYDYEPIMCNGDYVQSNYGDLEDYPHKHCIEQYTGLKDKNGKEIYEADIVRIHLGLNDFIEKKLIYDDENCMFTFKNTHEDCLCQFSEHYEIIGNIHEDQK